MFLLILIIIIYQFSIKTLSVFYQNSYQFSIKTLLVFYQFSIKINLFNFTLLQIREKPDQDLVLFLQIASEDVRDFTVEVNQDRGGAEAVLLLDVPVGAPDQLDLFLLQLVVDVLELQVGNVSVSVFQALTFKLYGVPP